MWYNGKIGYLEGVDVLIVREGTVTGYRYEKPVREAKKTGAARFRYGYGGVTHDHHPSVYLTIESCGVIYEVDIYHQLSKCMDNQITQKRAEKFCKGVLRKKVRFEVNVKGHGAILVIYPE